MKKLCPIILLPLLACCPCLADELLDFSKVIIVAPENPTKQHQSAIHMLVDEIAVRTKIPPPIILKLPADPRPQITITFKSGQSEGYQHAIESSSPPKITLSANDSR